MKVSRWLMAVLVSAGCSGAVDAQQPATQKPAPAPAKTTAPQQPASGQQVNADAAILADFQARVKTYLDVRKDALKGAPKLEETEDAGQIKAAQDAMSARIRGARKSAKRGDVFTPAITAKFRKLLSPELKGDDGRDAKAILKDDAPTNVPFKVNAKYPDGASVPTVPANLLLNLPMLPEPLQYRIIDKHLILLDEDADVIVDYALNVIR